jgi:acyl-coenzyme A thioesterase 13
MHAVTSDHAATKERESEMPMPYGDSPGHWEFLSSEGGKAEMSWTPTPDMANPFGSVHGGIIATVIDESCGAALMPLIETPSAPTVSLNVEYLHAVPIGGTYTVRSEIVRKGRAIAIADSRIINDEGTMLVRGTCFFQIPRPK